MDSEKALKAIEAIRQILDLDKHPDEYLPNPAVREDAAKEMSVIRENGPQPCHAKLPYLGRWLDDLFLQENDEGERLPAQRVKQIQGYALGILARIEAEVTSTRE